MTKNLRSKTRQRLLNRLHKKASSLRLSDMQGRALVLAPHFDDEVLGCGGTIATLARAGVDVHVWFLTDGGKSHSHLIAEDKLSVMRRNEAYLATGLLGIPRSNIRTWDLPDASLDSRLPAITSELQAEFDILQPATVFAPYRNDGPSDHEAAGALGASIIRRSKAETMLLEYAVWAWSAWPWTSLPLGGRREIPGRIIDTVRRNINLFRDFNTKLDIASCLDLKRQALEKYESQMRRIMPTERWKTLKDVGSGSFLENCLMRYEFFSRRDVDTNFPPREDFA